MYLRYFRYFIIIIVVFILIPAQHALARKTVRVGILVDEKTPVTRNFINHLQKELKQILGAEYKVLFPGEYTLISQWSADIARKSYFKLVKDKKVDIILVAGILSCSILTDQKVFKKPVIAVGILDHALQGVKPTSRNTSGIKNLTYILFNRSIERDLGLFHKVYPYKKVGIAASGELLRLLKNSTWPIESLMKEIQAEFVMLPADKSIDDVIKALGDGDAVYLEYLGRFEETDRQRLIKKLNRLGIPTFGSSLEDLELGALAAASPKESMLKVMRRIALNIESALAGEDLSGLPVGITFEERLTINMATAKKIGFSPGFEVLSQAEIINEFTDEGKLEYGLKDVMALAIRANLDLMIKKSEIETAEKDVKLAQANYFPTLSATLGGTMIDEKRAKTSGGSQAERTTNGKIRLEQLLFSEEQLGSVTSLKHQLESAKQDFQKTLLDVGLNAATAYINTMKAKTGIRIRKDNVTMTRKHLAIAKKKTAVGYAGRSDVYRLESNLATAQTELLAAKNSYKKLKIELNRIMNRSLTEAFTLKDTGLGRGFQGKYINRELKDYIDNPADLKRYTGFLVSEAIQNAPELKELDAAIAAVERRYTSLKRKRLFPVVSLGAESEHVFDRSGQGSNIPGTDPPDDIWSAGVNLTWSLYSGGATSTEIEKKRIEKKRLKKQKIRLTQSIEVTMRSAILDTVTKGVNLKSSAVSADFASKSLDLIRDAYAKGTASITELTDAQNTALNSDLNRLNSEYDFIMAVLTVERAAGSLTVLGSEINIREHLKQVEALMKPVNEEK